MPMELVIYPALQRLDYIARLGVDAIWISPFFASPQKILAMMLLIIAAFTEYGDMDDFDALISKAHDLGLKLMIDIVPAHCSDQHVWFQESRQSRDNDKADWFHWVDPLPDGSAPTNWLSFSVARTAAGSRADSNIIYIIFCPVSLI